MLHIFHGVEIEEIQLSEMSTDAKRYDYKGQDVDIKGNVCDIVEDTTSGVLYCVKNEAHWIFSKYFVKCSFCGYELLNGLNSRIAVPRRCPKCQSFMYKKED